MSSQSFFLERIKLFNFNDEIKQASAKDAYQMLTPLMASIIVISCLEEILEKANIQYFCKQESNHSVLTAATFHEKARFIISKESKHIVCIIDYYQSSQESKTIVADYFSIAEMIEKKEILKKN